MIPQRFLLLAGTFLLALLLYSDRVCTSTAKGPRSYESAEALLGADPVDLVDIVTRPDAHLPLTRLVAERGRHVICQKPMAPTRENCLAMCAVCERAGVRLLRHENWR